MPGLTTMRHPSGLWTATDYGTFCSVCGRLLTAAGGTEAAALRRLNETQPRPCRHGMGWLRYRWWRLFHA
jgi:hypothetical protein